MDSLTAELWEMGTAGIVEEADGLRAFFDDSVRRPVGWETRDETGAARQADVECDPILIGRRFYVGPSSLAIPGRLRLAINNSNAFGSGRHESTQLCLEVMEEHVKAGQCVVDIGCGSGILSAAAKMLGAGAVVSCDINEEVVRTARALVETPLFAGSADGLRTGLAHLVLANLSVRVLDVVAWELRRIVKEGGLVVIGGFLCDNPPKLFTSVECWRKNEWQCWVCRPEGIAADKRLGEPEAHSQQWWI